MLKKKHLTLSLLGALALAAGSSQAGYTVGTGELSITFSGQCSVDATAIFADLGSQVQGFDWPATPIGSLLVSCTDTMPYSLGAWSANTGAAAANPDDMAMVSGGNAIAYRLSTNGTTPIGDGGLTAIDPAYTEQTNAYPALSGLNGVYAGTSHPLLIEPLGEAAMPIGSLLVSCTDTMPYSLGAWSANTGAATASPDDMAMIAGGNAIAYRLSTDGITPIGDSGLTAIDPAYTEQTAAYLALSGLNGVYTGVSHPLFIEPLGEAAMPIGSYSDSLTLVVAWP